MSQVFNTNQSYADYPTAWRAWITFMTSNGALAHLQSGDGVSVLSSGSDVFNPAQLRSWWRGTLFGGVRQILLHRSNDGSGTAGRSMRVKLSNATGFVNAPNGGGSIDFQTPPSATDEVFISGGDVDNATFPTGARLFGASSTVRRYAMMVDPVLKQFYFINWRQSDGVIDGIFALDTLAAGSYDGTDGDPSVWYFAGDDISGSQAVASARLDQTFANLTYGSQALSFTGSSVACGGLRSWWKYGLGGATWTQTPAVAPATQPTANNIQVLAVNGLRNDITGVDQLAPVWYARDATVLSAPNGLRGVASLWRYQSGRASMSTFSVATGTSKEWVAFKSLALPWDGSTPDVTATPTNYPANLLLGLSNVSPPDTTLPVVTVVSPLPVGSTIATTAPLVFTVVLNSSASTLKRILVVVKFPGLRLTEVAYDGQAFTDAYAQGSVVSTVTNGLQFSLQRSLVWPDSPTVRIYALSSTGQEAA